MSFLIGLFVVLGISLGIVVWMSTIPIECIIAVNTQNRPAIQLRIRWFYGLLDHQVNTKSAKQKNEIDKKPKQKRRTTKKTPTKHRELKTSIKFAQGMLASKGFLPRVFKMMKDCLRVFELRDSRLYCTIGLPDPADTGQLTGVLGPVFLWLNRSYVPCARFEPNFQQEIFILDAGTTLRIIPSRFFWAMMQFSFSSELWKAIISGARATRK